MSTERTITLRKRMAASNCKDKEGREVQFLGSGYIEFGNFREKPVILQAI